MKIYIETLGCPKNIVDSECAAGILEKAGHEITEELEEADGVLVNTCSFVNDAKEESIDTVVQLGNYTDKTDKLMIVSGCLCRQHGEDVFKEIPEADMVIGVNEYEELPGLIDRWQKDQKRLLKCSEAPAKYEESSARKYPRQRHSMFLRLSEGCDNCCTYCVIPSIRGHFRSRRFEDILREAKQMADSGCKELTLVAQDVTNYGTDLYGRYKISELLDELCKIDGIKWIRLMYCYSDKIDDALMEAMAKHEKVCKYIDMPIQHASDNILTAMGRKGKKSDILKTIEMLREKVPGIHIRTTLIVGFPGERREDFEELTSFVKEIKFERLGVFSYSKEEKTPAANMKGQIKEAVKQKRKDIIMQEQQAISLALNEKKIGSIQEVLIEEIIEEPAEDFAKEPGEGFAKELTKAPDKVQDENEKERLYMYAGRSRYDAIEIDNAVTVLSEKPLLPGDFVHVKITDAFDYDLIGETI